MVFFIIGFIVSAYYWGMTINKPAWFITLDLLQTPLGILRIAVGFVYTRYLMVVCSPEMRHQREMAFIKNVIYYYVGNRTAIKIESLINIVIWILIVKHSIHWNH